MVYASSKDGLKKKLDGVYTEIQCTDLSEVSHETVLDKVCLTLSADFTFLTVHLSFLSLGFSHD
jgi:hypothetical protein